uniref:SCP domain-containing protein n=1 Tax=Angiostrongylus cantonensis TaxID=6313 RepID=A0A0K0D505_ANGCA
LLRAGSARKYECRARCVNYRDEEHVTFEAWRDIKDPSPFHCDFVQTECSSRKKTISYVHMQIAELRILNYAKSRNRYHITEFEQDCNEYEIHTCEHSSACAHHSLGFGSIVTGHKHDVYFAKQKFVPGRNHPHSFC